MGNFESKSELTSQSEWTLLYHKMDPAFPGRSQAIRMLFVDAGVPFTESAQGLYGPTGICDAFRGVDSFKAYNEKCACQQLAPYPVMAPPIIWHQPENGDPEVFINQLPAILRYVGCQLGYAPDSKNFADIAKCDKIILDVGDYISEGRSSFHPVDNGASYNEQKEEGDISSKKWSETRMLVWLHCFEKILEKRTSESGFVVGDSVTYADIALYWLCDATVAQFDNEKYDFAWTKANIPLLKKFKEMFDNRPNIKSWTNKIPYSGDSLM